MLLSFGNRPLSLRSKLLLFLGSLFLGATVVLAAAAREYGRRAADHAYDQLLAGSALAIAETVNVIGGAIDADLPYAALDMLSLAPEDRVFYRIAAPEGETVTGYFDLPFPEAITVTGQPQFFEAEYKGELVRFCILGRLVAEPGAQGWATVQIGQTQRAREALARSIAFDAITPILALSALALGLAWVGVNHALRPLVRVGVDLQDRRPTDLHPVATPAPREIQLLVDSLNRFMQRLRINMDNMQVFIADAAHQIRTPLSSLRVQAQTALDEDDPLVVRRSLERIERNAVLASRLAHQLLSHAMVVHRGEAMAFERVHLAEVLRHAMREAIPLADDRRIGIDYRNAAGQAPIQGDRVMLREALKNVLDNAVRHGCACSPRISVSLFVDDAGREHCVAVSDNGPGIPAPDRESIFDRFRRGANAEAAGSGLGLAIVKRVMDAHGGSVDLSDGAEGGLAVTLRFPMPADAEARP
ncbi:MAG TPA: sensor histidine kinase [Alphaproteobacteria bacterium]|nr:sensor histidine kinase [Alphaproteobacteria bacterium]